MRQRSNLLVMFIKLSSQLPFVIHKKKLGNLVECLERQQVVYRLDLHTFFYCFAKCRIEKLSMLFLKPLYNSTQIRTQDNRFRSKPVNYLNQINIYFIVIWVSLYVKKFFKIVFSSFILQGVAPFLKVTITKKNFLFLIEIISTAGVA